ncbi:MAG: GNAT family N-acetyltransferase [Comamonas sp.]
MELQFHWSRLESLTGLEVHEILQARVAVFVVEQKCPYQEVDDMDPLAWHLTARLGGQLAAYIRVVDPGVKYPQPSIGRVMTLANFRHRQLGRALMAEAIRFTELKFPGLGIQIGAQVYLQQFYASFGFEAVGEVYEEDGIPHLDMVRELGAGVDCAARLPVTRTHPAA